MLPATKKAASDVGCLPTRIWQVLEAPFAAPLGLIADALTLKEHGVEV